MICGQLKPDRTPTADVFDSDQRVVLQTGCDASWRGSSDSFWTLSDSARVSNLRHRLRFRINSGVTCERGPLIHLVRDQVCEGAPKFAHHCLHSSRVRPGLRMTHGLRMTRTTPVDPLCPDIPRVKRFLWTAFCLRCFQLELKL